MAKETINFDSHIHIGQFYDQNHTPEQVDGFLREVGVHTYAVSSTTTCLDYKRALKEMQEVVRIGGKRVVPVLWVAPAMLHDGWLEHALDCGIEWRCLKIHGYFHNWNPDGAEVEQVVAAAQRLQAPLLLHTGGRPASDCGSYLNLIRRHPEQRFILAHSRPVDQAIEVMTQCPNAWADTAFTPKEDIAQLIERGFADRVLFGTDYPLHNFFYSGQDMKAVYASTVRDAKSVMSEEDWEKVSHLNFEKLFAL